MGLDWHWLSFFQFTSGNVFSRISPDNPIDPLGEYGRARVFDPRGSWLIEHQNKRPFGEGLVPEAGSGGGAAAAGSGGASGTAATSGTSDGMGIPGGTAGAAVGLAPMN
jgi:hypothetical protein